MFCSLCYIAKSVYSVGYSIYPVAFDMLLRFHPVNVNLLSNFFSGCLDIIVFCQTELSVYSTIHTSNLHRSINIVWPHFCLSSHLHIYKVPSGELINVMSTQVSEFFLTRHHGDLVFYSSAIASYTALHPIQLRIQYRQRVLFKLQFGQEIPLPRRPLAVPCRNHKSHLHTHTHTKGKEELSFT